MLFTDQQLQDVREGRIETLADLDQRGFLLGPDESLDDYATRLQALESNLAELESELAETGQVDIDDLQLPASERIPPELFEEGSQTTRRLFGFAIDWVPGFFVDPSFSWLFGGCAYSFFPDFMTLFIIRKSFAVKSRWLIYRRDELLAHELCHVARIAMQSSIYEETFAYQTATSRFRRMAGSLFRTPLDSFLLLGSTMLLLTAQILRVFVYPSLPVGFFWLGLVLVITFLVVRHCLSSRLFNRAVRLFDIYSPGYGLAMAFRCSDAELLSVARLDDSDTLAEWLQKQCEGSLRWEIIVSRFTNCEHDCERGYD